MTQAFNLSQLANGVDTSGLLDLSTNSKNPTWSANVTGYAFIPSSSTVPTNGLFLPAANTVALSTGTTERMRIDSSGNVGIGTNAPASFGGKLAIYKSPGTAYTDSSIAMTDGSNVTLYIGNTSTTASSIWTSDLLSFGTGADAFTERARITSGGEFLVGTTSTSGTTGNGFKVLSSGETVNVVTAQTANANRSTYEFYSTGASAYRFYVGAGGTVYATSTTISAISDQRLKENIRDLDDGLDAVMALKPRKFDWKEGKGKDIKGDRGWIAQEFEQVFPEMISTWKDEPPEGEEPYKSVAADLIPVLTKAIQELKAINDAQATRIETLEAQNAAFEARLAALENK